MNCLLRFCSLNWMTHIVVNVIEKETNKSHHFNLFDISVNGEGLEIEKFIGSEERFQRVMYTAINWPHLNMRFFYLRWLAFGIHTKKNAFNYGLEVLRHMIAFSYRTLDPFGVFQLRENAFYLYHKSTHEIHEWLKNSNVKNKRFISFFYRMH